MNVYRVLRWMLFVLAAAAGVALLSSCNPPPTKKLVVTTTVDGEDANVGDGVCEATPAAGDCTLRAAIQEANASPIRADITVPPLVFNLTLTADAGFLEALEVGPASGSVYIHAPLPGAKVVRAPTDNVQVLDVYRGTVSISGIGFVAPMGPFYTNYATYLVAESGTTLNLAAMSVGTLQIDSGATVHALNSTFDGPSDYGPGGVFSYGTFEARFSTFGVLAGHASTTLGSSVVRVGCDGSTQFQSLGYNLLPTAGTCPASGPGDQLTDDARVGPKTATPIPSLAPQVGSPALDSIPAGVGPCAGSPPPDQHGNPRPTHGACDRGAIEAQPPRSFSVTTSADVHDRAIGDGVCATPAGPCSLRAAFDEMWRWNDGWAPNTVTLNSDVTMSIAGAGDDANVSGDYDVGADLVIEGNGHTLDAKKLDRVIDHQNGSLTIRRLKITGGSVQGAGALGGGVRTRDTEVLLEDDTISGNAVSGSGALGGGIGIQRGDATVRRSTFASNSASGYSTSGGAIYMIAPGPTGQLDVSNSTFVGNSAFFGAAIDSFSGRFEQTLVRSSTFVGNSGANPIGGGMAGTQVSGSVFSSGNGLCYSGVSSLGWNVGMGGDACSLSAPTDLIVSDLMLGPLAANGGPTPTLLPQAGSPLLDRIPVGTAGLCDATTTTDQRGSVRPHGSACDVGSVER